VRYRGSTRKILLQNENGPCPLLAAANALLLRGEIDLDPACVRSGVASAEDVVNALADRAAANAQSRSAASSRSANDDDDDDDDGEYRLNEALGLLPGLRHGMDVNPRFASGPSGVEYTAELAAFDLLGVELVHGWLLDPQDIETSYVVSSKTYNELIETVIVGSEAREAMKVIEGRLVGLEGRHRGGYSSSAEDVSPAAMPDREEGGDIIDPAHPERSPPHLPSSEGDEIDPSRKAIVDAREEMHELSLRIARSEVADAFLTSSGHQLTHHGLMRLHEHVGEDALCVFFRNNHFATLTRHDGGLYLLVTDLGYANTPEIVWEKLDDIDGDT